ncbi:TetR family transcriptional regulator [Streptomyces varsoviensis]|uniref:TetR family transcriptional regulator n=1 Tax=Streptomyces varsoviensis TaxID=67373 RepID=A0ABR5J5E2_9ACTN|nr:TetR family transcriptional regulator [Streptomyces varsoviensis]
MTTETKDRLVEAATAVLRTHGYAGASARTIAKAAGVNSALVFYHFGGVDQLLLAALDRSSAERMALHSATVAPIRTIEELADAATRIYRDDVDGGHVTVFCELVAAAVARPELARLTSPRELANAAIAFYLGVNLFSVLDADRSRTESVFRMVRRLAPRAKLLTLRLPKRRNGVRRAAD